MYCWNGKYMVRLWLMFAAILQSLLVKMAKQNNKFLKHKNIDWMFSTWKENQSTQRKLQHVHRDRDLHSKTKRERELRLNFDSNKLVVIQRFMSVVCFWENYPVYHSFPLECRSVFRQNSHI